MSSEDISSEPLLQEHDFHSLYESHAPMALRRAQRLLGDTEAARDVVQQIFASLLHRPQQFDGRSRFSTFLYAATTNLCLNHLRNARRRRRLLTEHQHQSPRITQSGSHNDRDIWEVVATLPDNEAKAMVYCFVDEMSHAEASHMLGVSRRQVGKLIERARERLLHHWQEEDRSDA